LYQPAGSASATPVLGATWDESKLMATVIFAFS
jgi:hypothetical protein